MYETINSLDKCVQLSNLRNRVVLDDPTCLESTYGPEHPMKIFMIYSCYDTKP